MYYSRVLFTEDFYLEKEVLLILDQEVFLTRAQFVHQNFNA